MVGMATTKQVKQTLARLEEECCIIKYDAKAGTAVVTDQDGTECYRALQKGKGQPWIVKAITTRCIMWVEGKPKQAPLMPGKL